MDKKVVISKVMNKLSRASISGDEVDLENIPEKYKQQHGFGKGIEGAYLNKNEKDLVILSEGVFLPYAKDVKIISINPHDDDYVQVKFQLTDSEVKEILKKEKDNNPEATNE